MYSIFSVLCGLIIAIMIVINGELSATYDVFIATAIIHIVGVMFSFAVIKITKKELKFIRGLPFWAYLGGAFGILTTIFNNYAFGKISVTSIMALGLFGQMATSLVIDSFGLFGMKKHLFQKSALIGLAFSLLGVIVMLDNTVSTGLISVIFSFGAGITVVLTRTVNGTLSKHTGALQGSFINHLVGLPISIVVALAVSANAISSFSFSPHLYIYLGGTLGVTVVLLSNLTVRKMPAYKLTTLMFCGQIFTGIVIDLIISRAYDFTSLLGGLLVSAGFLVNIRKK